MSTTITTVQHLGLAVKLIMGFDSHNQGYYMVIEPVDLDNPNADEESGLIYSNLADKQIPFPGTLPNIDHYKKVLRDMNIDVPAEFFGRMLAEAD